MNTKYKIKNELSKEKRGRGNKKKQMKINFCYVNRDFENLKILKLFPFRKKSISVKSSHNFYRFFGM